VVDGVKAIIQICRNAFDDSERQRAERLLVLHCGVDRTPLLMLMDRLRTSATPRLEITGTRTI
jgi:hypothetical protein